MTIDLRTGSEVAAFLDLHERRRGRGVPTVSALAGPVGLGLREALAWAEARGRSMVRIVDPDPCAALEAWTARVVSERDLPRAAAGWLARRLGRTVTEVERRLRGMTPFERETFLDDVLVDARGAEQSVFRRLLVMLGSEVPSVPESFVREIGPRGLSRPVLASAVLELVPAGHAPVLVISVGRNDSSHAADFGRLAELAAHLAEAEPGLAVLLAVDLATLEGYLGDGVASRPRALLRESVIRIPALKSDALHRRLGEARPGLADALAGPATRIGLDGASELLADLFSAAAVAVADLAEGRPEAAEIARSAAERFLYERLESLPETAGLFRLNGRTGFTFGSGHAMEVDLLSVELRLAVEVDGYYHFRDDDAYRRDRRKDLELQRQGYLVVRVLADDIVRRLEEILETILESVAHQARHSQRS